MICTVRFYDLMIYIILKSLSIWYFLEHLDIISFPNVKRIWTLFFHNRCWGGLEIPMKNFHRRFSKDLMACAHNTHTHTYSEESISIWYFLQDLDSISFPNVKRIWTLFFLFMWTFVGFLSLQPLLAINRKKEERLLAGCLRILMPFSPF